MKKTVYTLNIDNYAPEITAITYPLIRHYAHRIGVGWFRSFGRAMPLRGGGSGAGPGALNG